MKKTLSKIISTCLIVTIMICSNQFTNIISTKAQSIEGSGNLTNPHSDIFDAIDIDMTISEYYDLSFSEQQQILNHLSTNIFPPKIEPMYKSGEDDPTHQVITSQAVGALINDKGFISQDKTEAFLLAMVISVYSGAPDQYGDESYNFTNYDHFYCVDTGKGLSPHTRSANDAFCEYYMKAVNCAKSGDMPNAMAHLGRALHFSQDASVPHHTISYLTIAHAEYEKYCNDNIENFISNINSISAGDYTMTLNANYNKIVPSIARIAHLYYEDSKDSTDQSLWSMVASRQTAASTKRTAAIINKFINDANISLYTY